MKLDIPKPVLIASGFLLLVSIFAAFAYGVVVQRYRIFPFKHIAVVEEAVTWSVEQATGTEAWYYQPYDAPIPGPKFAEGFDTGQLYLISGFGPDEKLFVRVIDAGGDIKNEWRIDWFELWPDATHLPPNIVPKMPPGTHVHGVTALDNGDILFNLEYLGLLRMSMCGEVIWKLPYETHHSITPDEQGNFWVSGRITHLKTVEGYPNLLPTFFEPTVIQVSPAGEVLQEISILEMFVRNDLKAYLYLSALSNGRTDVTGDTLHLNDVEVFPTSMEEGIFRHGDIMVSLRNISTVIVFDPDTLKIRHLKTGQFTRQHDPDFIDGNTYSVFDNNNIAPKNFGQHSRIRIVAADTNEVVTWYEGSAEHPFYTAIMGKHQFVSDNELLITDATNGRVIQVDENGSILWEYFNKVEANVVGNISEATLLPESTRAVFTVSQQERCADSRQAAIP